MIMTCSLWHLQSWYYQVSLNRAIKSSLLSSMTSLFEVFFVLSVDDTRLEHVPMRLASTTRLLNRCLTSPERSPPPYL